MQDSAKYLIHADITATGVVERSDVVGAVFGQTEGLLGDELDLRQLQESGKVGRIDVQISSEGGASYGEITIATGLDKVETAILAAALESIERVGPCKAGVEVTDIEDVRSAKRRQVVERATELLAAFEETTLTSEELVEQVRQNLRVEDITEYEGLPAGPRVVDSDAIIVVEGRADVLTLLQYGVKNAVAVEGTDVPQAVVDLADSRTVTAFLDRDRGGDLIFKELAQVADIDYVAVAPADQSVEDLSREEIMRALREKRPFEAVAEAGDPSAFVEGREDRAAPPETAADRTPESEGAASVATEDDTGETQDSGTTTGPTHAATAATGADVADPAAGDTVTTAGEAAGADTAGAAPVDAESVEDAAGGTDTTAPEADAGDTTAGASDAEETGRATPEPDEDGDATAETDPQTLAGHVQAVIAGETGRIRLLDADFGTLTETDAEAAFETVQSADPVPAAVVLDGELTQRVLDVAAQRGVEQVVGREEGEFVKRPTDVRIRTVADFEG